MNCSFPQGAAPIANRRQATVDRRASVENDCLYNSRTQKLFFLFETVFGASAQLYMPIAMQNESKRKMSTETRGYKQKTYCCVACVFQIRFHPKVQSHCLVLHHEGTPHFHKSAHEVSEHGVCRSKKWLQSCNNTALESTTCNAGGITCMSLMQSRLSMHWSFLWVYIFYLEIKYGSPGDKKVNREARQMWMWKSNE